MANRVQRTVCMCDEKYIGIESVYTVINGKQINIPEKVEALRAKGREGLLLCPCGCGAKLMLVAGDKNLRAQHFRIKTMGHCSCTAENEGDTSICSKIVLKCWLDDKLHAEDIEARVPICLLGDTRRKYEFSFLSRTRKIAISYTYSRANLSDEKFDILRANSRGIQLIYIVDISNAGNNGQYPEFLKKIQKRKGYCLLLDAPNMVYADAKLRALYYEQDCDKLWQEISISDGALRDYSITEGGQLLYRNTPLPWLLNEKRAEFREQVKQKQEQREQNRARYEAEIQRSREQAEQRRREEQRLAMEKTVREKEAAARRIQQKRQDELFAKNPSALFDQQETEIIDSHGVQWLRCKFCGVIDNANVFPHRGHDNHKNQGICRSCWKKGYHQL